MKIIYTKDKEFKTEFENILKRAKSDIKGVSKIVENIIDEIVEDGNEALKRHIEKFQSSYNIFTRIAVNNEITSFHNSCNDVIDICF